MQMTMVPTLLGPIYVDDQGDAGQPVALLWPSLFTDHRMWRHQIPAMRTAGWRTLAVDPPSHGRSVGPGRNFTMDECAEAALQALDQLGVAAPVVVLGTSWGGFVAPRIALKAPERIRGMILFNTSAQQPMPSQRAKAMLLTTLMRFRALDGFVDGINVSTLLAADTRERRPEIGEQMVQEYRTWNRGNFLAAIRSVLLERRSILDELSAIDVPVLVVSGAQDTILPTILSRTLASRLSRAEVVEVEGAAHLAPLDAPDRANALIGEFLRRLASGKQAEAMVSPSHRTSSRPGSASHQPSEGKDN